MIDLIDKLVEATASDILRKHRSIKRLFPDFDKKTKGVEDKGGIRLDDQDPETWKFRLHSGTKDDVWYDGYIHFKNVKPTLERLVKDRRFWTADKSRVDLRKLAKEFMNRADIQLFCSCPADLYWGGHYIRSLGKYDAKYTRKETRPPKVRNPRQYGMVCKHLDRLLKAFPFYGSTMAKWLRDFYGKEIREWEDEAKEEFGWVKRAAAALRKRRAGVPEEPEELEEPEEEEEEKPKKKVRKKPKRKPGKRLRRRPEREPEKPEEEPEVETPRKRERPPEEELF